MKNRIRLNDNQQPLHQNRFAVSKNQKLGQKNIQSKRTCSSKQNQESEIENDAIRCENVRAGKAGRRTEEGAACKPKPHRSGCTLLHNDQSCFRQKHSVFPNPSMNGLVSQPLTQIMLNHDSQNLRPNLEQNFYDQKTIKKFYD